MAKKTERGPFSLARYCILRGKRGTFGSVHWSNTPSVEHFVELLVELF